MVEGRIADKRTPTLRPWVIALATIPALLLGAGLVTVLLVLQPLLKDRVIQEARARGVELSIAGDVDVWFGSVSLSEANFTFEGVEGLKGKADRVDVMLDGLRPVRATVEGVDVELTRPVPDMILDATEWARRHPPKEEFPVSATNVAVNWRSSPEGGAWLQAEGGRTSHSPAGFSFFAERARVAGLEVQNVGASWTESDAALTLALGSTNPRDATLSVNVDRKATPPRATIVLAPTPLDHLTGPLALPLPTQGVSTTARAELVLPPSPEIGGASGHVDIELDNFTPPHPVELDGFDFGKKTTVSTDLTISPDYGRMDLSEMHVRAGSFALRGGGTVTRHEDYAIADLTLKGNLPCNAIARSAARARVGSVLGKVLGNAAHRILEGSVGVAVRVVADSRNPGAAKLERRIGIGCGLKPMSLAEIADLGLDSMSELAVGLGVPQNTVDRARGTIESIPSALPTLPSAMPTVSRPTLSLPSSLPSLPSSLPPFPFEIRRKDEDAKQPAGGTKAAPAPSASP